MKTDNYKKVGTFLKDLTPTEYRYLQLTMQLVTGFNELIDNYKLTKEQFCELFEIKPAKYENYVKGNYNYTLEDMVNLTYVWKKLEKQRIDEQELIKINVEDKE